MWIIELTNGEIPMKHLVYFLFDETHFLDSNNEKHAMSISKLFEHKIKKNWKYCRKTENFRKTFTTVVNMAINWTNQIVVQTFLHKLIINIMSKLIFPPKILLLSYCWQFSDFKSNGDLGRSYKIAFKSSWWCWCFQ